MIALGAKRKLTTLDVVKEDTEERYVLYSTPIREKKIKVHWPRLINNAMWQITYEDGTKIDDSLSGKYLSKREALKALTLWEDRTSLTPQARYKDKTPPVLKRKKVLAASKQDS